ncbi:MAG: SAF domain-containing protein [Arachnia sp.]
MTWIIRTISWHRRKVAAVLAALGTFALLTHFSGAAEPSTAVVVLARSVDAGAALTLADLSRVDLPVTHVPAGALRDPAEAVGRSAAVSLSASTIIQPALLVSGAPPPPGRSLVPITVRESQLREILSPGTRVALVSSMGDVPGIVTEDAVIHSMPQTPASSPLSGGQATLVLVEVPTGLAPDVSMLGQSGQLSFFLSG